MKKLVILSLIAVFFYSSILVSIHAQESTNSAETTDEVKQNIKERLEKAAKEEGAVLGKTDKKAYVGTLESLTQNTLTIKTLSGSKQVAVAENAKIIGAKREALKVDDLEIGSYLIAMGFTTDNDFLDGRRIVVTDKPLTSAYLPYQIKITSIKKDVIAAQSTEASKQSWELKSAKTTTITQTFAGNQAEIELTDLKVDDTLIVLGKPDAKKSTLLEVTAIHLPQGRAIISQPNEESTASAKKSSPTPTPKPSPTE